MDALPPSPLKPNVPLPATVVMTPVATATRRTRCNSEIYQSPAASSVTCTGSISEVCSADCPSPVYPPPGALVTV